MEPTEKEVADAQMNDVFPELASLQKSVDDIKGDITQLFDRLADLAEEVDKLRKG